MIREKMQRLQEQIQWLQAELDFYNAMYDDFVVGNHTFINVRTDHIYKMFCERHPDIKVSQQKFSRTLCAEFDVKSVQSFLDGKRGSFYERC